MREAGLIIYDTITMEEVPPKIPCLLTRNDKPDSQKHVLELGFVYYWFDSSANSTLKPVGTGAHPSGVGGMYSIFGLRPASTYLGILKKALTEEELKIFILHHCKFKEGDERYYRSHTNTEIFKDYWSFVTKKIRSIQEATYVILTRLAQLPRIFSILSSFSMALHTACFATNESYGGLAPIDTLQKTATFMAINGSALIQTAVNGTSDLLSYPSLCSSVFSRSGYLMVKNLTLPEITRSGFHMFYDHGAINYFGATSEIITLPSAVFNPLATLTIISMFTLLMFGFEYITADCPAYVLGKVAWIQDAGKKARNLVLGSAIFAGAMQWWLAHLSTMENGSSITTSAAYYACQGVLKLASNQTTQVIGFDAQANEANYQKLATVMTGSLICAGACAAMTLATVCYRSHVIRKHRNVAKEIKENFVQELHLE